ncbi:MAG: hypothetical protein JW974_03045 [Alphaproteobacteria bacterium]|nr:hypothetical protein [Alphaproteobacteria bacterium]MBN2674926.1 hypothetical protein [Alphaproteobacteria bacterium]
MRKKFNTKSSKIILSSALLFVICTVPSFAKITSKDYVDRIVSSGGFEEIGNKTTVISGTSTDTQYPSAKAVFTHISDTSNPHNVTQTQIGLSNVQNVDQTNASNLISGVVPFPLLPTGTTANTVATGDDSRFWAVPTTAHTGTAPAGWAWIWIAP